MSRLKNKTKLLLLTEKCECGDSCEMKDGGKGLCGMMGKCHPETRPPHCDEWDECECGKHCKMENRTVGVCQNDGSCALNTMRPNCTDWPGSIKFTVEYLQF